MRLIKLIVLVAIFILILAVYNQNDDIFTHRFDLGVDLIFYQTPRYELANILIILSTFVLGVIFAGIFGAFSSLGTKKKLKEKDKEIKELKNSAPEKISTYCRNFVANC